MDLAKHPFFAETDPVHSRLVRLSAEFPDWLNSYVADGVVMRAAGIPGEVDHSKSYMARELIKGGIEQGFVTPKTIIKAATSGNTGHGLGTFCRALGLRCDLILPGGTVPGKVNALRVIGGGVEVILHNNPDETTVERARREGAQDGCWDSDQYANLLNPFAHKTYLAPQLLGTATRIDLLGVASGTMGTCMGLMQYVTEHGLSTRVLPVVLEEGHEVPGARPLSKIKKDIQLRWQELFADTDLEFGTRHPSFLLAFYSWSWVPKALGPSFGLAFQGTLRHLHKRKLAGTLDELRGPDGKIQVVILGADSSLLYLDLFMGETKAEERYSRARPDLLALAA